MHNLLLIALGLGLAAGQLAAFSVGRGARVSLLDGVVLVVLIFTALRQSGKRFIPPLWAPILAFSASTLLSLASLWGSTEPYVIGGGLLYGLRWLIYAALYWAAAGTGISAHAWRMTLMTSGIATAVFGIVQYILYPDLRNLSYLGWDPHYMRLFGTLLDPNFAGIILCSTILLQLRALVKRIEILPLAGLLVSVPALVLTYSRSSLLAFAVGLGVWAILTGRKKIAWGLVGTALLLILVLPRTGEGRNLLRTASSLARLHSAERALTLMQARPIFGMGFNILGFTARNKSSLDLPPNRAGAGLDTSLLFVAVTTGIIGLATYVWLLVSLVRSGTAKLGASKNKEDAAVYLAILAGIFVHSLFLNSLFYPWVMAWMWILAGTLEQKHQG